MNLIKKFSIKLLAISIIASIVFIFYYVQGTMTNHLNGSYTLYDKNGIVIKTGKLTSEEGEHYTWKGSTILPNTWIVFFYDGTTNGGFPIKNGDTANIVYALDRMAKHTVRISHITYADYQYSQKTNRFSYEPEDSPLDEPTYVFALRNDSSEPFYLESFTVERED